MTAAAPDSTAGPTGGQTRRRLNPDSLEPAKTLALRWVAPRLAGRGRAGHVALTFDDGPDPASTPAFLELLDRLGWRATFFMLGTMAEKHPSLAAEVLAAGHEIGSHSYTHASQYLGRPSVVRSDVRRGAEAVGEVTGQAPAWFRPPYGSVSVAGTRAAAAVGMRTVIWTACGQDWRADSTADTVMHRLRRTFTSGATVLLHDSDCVAAPLAWKSTLGALPRLAELAAERGLQVGPLGDHGLR